MGTVIIGKRPTFSSVPALAQGRHSAVAHIQRQEKWAANCVRHCLRGKSSLWCSRLLYFSDPFKNWLPLLCLAPMNCQSTWCLLSAKTSWLCMAQCTGDNETKLSFLLLRRVWASLFLMFPYFPPSSAWHKSLRASAMERKKKSFQNCPYKSMWICVCTHMEWVYCLEQLSSWERKLSSLQSMAVWNHLHHNNLTSAIFAFVVLQNPYQLLLDSWAVLSSAKRPKEQSH